MDKIYNKNFPKEVLNSYGNYTFDEKHCIDDYLKNATLKTQQHFNNVDFSSKVKYVNYIDHYLNDNKVNPSYDDYLAGEILLVDFGAMNFGYELSYPHPAIVINQTTAFVLVAPCSSQKNGRHLKNIMDGQKCDGFVQRTGVILDNVKWVSKGRVISRIGEVNKQFLNKLKERLVSTIL